MKRIKRYLIIFLVLSLISSSVYASGGVAVVAKLGFGEVVDQLVQNGVVTGAMAQYLSENTTSMSDINEDACKRIVENYYGDIWAGGSAVNCADDIVARGGSRALADSTQRMYDEYVNICEDEKIDYKEKYAKMTELIKKNNSTIKQLISLSGIRPKMDYAHRTKFTTQNYEFMMNGSNGIYGNMVRAVGNSIPSVIPINTKSFKEDEFNKAMQYARDKKLSVSILEVGHKHSERSKDALNHLKCDYTKIYNKVKYYEWSNKLVAFVFTDSPITSHKLVMGEFTGDGSASKKGVKYRIYGIAIPIRGYIKMGPEVSNWEVAIYNEAKTCVFPYTVEPDDAKIAPCRVVYPDVIKDIPIAINPDVIAKQLLEGIDGEAVVKDIVAHPDVIPQQVEDTVKVGTVVPDMVVDIDDEGIISAIDDIGDHLKDEGEGELDFSPLKVSFWDRFPFCIPWDIKSIFGQLKATGEPYKLVVDFAKFSPVFAKAEPIVLDFGDSIWNGFIKVFRGTVLIGFIIFLCIKTRDIIKG